MGGASLNLVTLLPSDAGDGHEAGGCHPGELALDGPASRVHPSNDLVGVEAPPGMAKE